MFRWFLAVSVLAWTGNSEAFVADRPDTMISIEGMLLVGSWEYKSGSYEKTMTFAGNGQYSDSYYSWIAPGNITYGTTRSNYVLAGRDVHVFVELAFSIVRIDEATLVTRDRKSGKTQEWHRVPDKLAMERLQARKGN